MLRWNATDASGPYFVHVSSLRRQDDSTYTMTAVLPPAYSYEWSIPQPYPAAESTLDLRTGAYVSIDLGFSFPYFGLTNTQAWVSSTGFLAFEEQSQVAQPFGDGSAVYSAVVASGGDFDMDHSQAVASLSRPSPTLIKISWHAPLFRSNEFSTVSMLLSQGGGIEIRKLISPRVLG